MRKMMHKMSNNPMMAQMAGNFKGGKRR
jgi:hypothetical protein